MPRRRRRRQSLRRAPDAPLLAYVRPYGWLVASALGCLMVDGLMQLVGPLMTQRVIDVALPAHDWRWSWRSALLFAASLVVAFACQYGETILTESARPARDARSAHATSSRTCSACRSCSSTAIPVGRLVTRVTSDVESLNELFTAGVVAGLGDLFTLLAISALMLVTDWRLALASFARDPVRRLGVARLSAKVRDSYRDIRTRLARINAYLQERITGMRVVQLFGRERDEARRFDELNRGHLDANLESITYYALYFPAIEILTSIALASLIVAGAHRVEIGSLTRRNRRGVSPAGAPVLSAAAGSVGQVQHAAAGDGRVRARFSSLGHGGGGARRKAGPPLAYARARGPLSVVPSAPLRCARIRMASSTPLRCARSATKRRRRSS